MTTRSRLKLFLSWRSPSTRFSSVQELLARGAAVIVLATGVYERLQVRSDTLRTLEDHGIDVHVEPTGAAVERYNQLIDKGRAVGALIHSTC